jgi:hypothetical protein
MVKFKIANVNQGTVTLELAKSRAEAVREARDSVERPAELDGNKDADTAKRYSDAQNEAAQQVGDEYDSLLAQLKELEADPNVRVRIVAAE